MFLKQSDILEAAEALEYTLVVLVVLVLVMERIPNLSKERVDLCLGIVCPVELLAFAVGGKLLRAPVTALENKVRGHLKLVAVSALPLQRSEQVCLLYTSDAADE